MSAAPALSSAAAREEIAARYRAVWTRASDIRDHLPTLRWYAAQCERVTELGTRAGTSTTALLAAEPKSLACYDLQRHENLRELERIAGGLGVEFRFTAADVREVEIAPTDLLFIDTYHHHDQLTIELARHAPKAGRFIILHDTMTFGWKGENGTSGDGLLTALHEFLYRHREWSILESVPHNNGLTVLGRGPQAGAPRLPPPQYGVERAGRTLDFSEALDRPETILPETPRLGVVVGTYASVPYVHLQLEARRRLYPEVPLLVHDDASARGAELRALCADYGAEFESNLQRGEHDKGDLSVFLGGLLWARERGLDLLVKWSRRFLPLRDWRPELLALARASQYPTYSSWTRHLRFGFRTECTALAVEAWFRGGATAGLAQGICGRHPGLVEAFVHNLARQLATGRCRHALAYDHAHGYRPGEIDGYAVWPFLGFDRATRYPEFLWYDSASPAEYAALAREWDLPYAPADFGKVEGLRQ